MEYKIAKNLSSREFYKMINVFDEILRPDETVVLDFSEVTRIDSVVIPNLLLAGKYIETKTGNIPFIRLGDNLNTGYIKNYLSRINFYELSTAYYFFEDEEAKYNGMVGKEMDRCNTTQRFEFSRGQEEAMRRLYYGLLPYISKYLKIFHSDEPLEIYRINDDKRYNNFIAFFLNEMIDNSFRYSKTDNIITVQTNYKKKRIYLSASDLGKGFLGAMLDSKHMDEKGNFLDQDGTGDPGINILNHRPNNMEEALIIGIYKRMHSKKHGLYNIVDEVLQMNGTVRIHSVDKQIILTGRLKEEFKTGEFSQKYENYRDYNIVTTKSFNGVHCEIELPLDVFYGEN